jgi:beta-lactamase class A
LTFALLWTALPAVGADPLQGQLDAMAKAHHGKVALYAHNLKTDQTVEIDAETPVKTASVIKLTVLSQAMHEVKDGKKSLADKVTLRKEDIVNGSGVLQFFDTPLTISFKDVLTQMILESDNTATNLAIDHLGGTKAVNDRIAALGLKNTRLYKRIGRRATEKLPDDYKLFGLGKTTAREMAEVIEGIQNCEVGDKNLCEQMLYMLRNQQWRNCIPHYLELIDTSEELSMIANKTGSLDAVRNDVGIVYSAAGPIVISAFTYENQDQSWNADNEAELLIARMARAIVQSWSPQGLAKKAPAPGEK